MTVVYRPSRRAILFMWLRGIRLALRTGATLPTWWEARVALLGYHGEFEEAHRIIRQHGKKRS